MAWNGVNDNSNPAFYRAVIKGMNKKAAPLVIVDMQPFFDAANHKGTIKECLKLISFAKRQKALIILVEYDYYGKSCVELTRALRNYPHKMLVLKTRDNGGYEVFNALKEKGLSFKTYRFCGVNATCCVHDTISGLLSHQPKAKIEVVKEACNDNNYSKKSSECWRRSAYTRPNVKLFANTAILRKKYLSAKH